MICNITRLQCTVFSKFTNLSMDMCWFIKEHSQLMLILFYLIKGCFWKEKKKQQKFSLYAFTAEQQWISAKIGKCC